MFVVSQARQDKSMPLLDYKVSLFCHVFSGNPNHLTERFDIHIAASSKAFALERAYAVASAAYGLAGTAPGPLKRHKTYELGATHLQGCVDGDLLSVSMGIFRPQP